MNKSKVFSKKKLWTGARVDEEGPASERGAWMQVGRAFEGHVSRMLVPDQCRVELTCMLDQGEALAGDTAGAFGGLRPIIVSKNLKRTLNL